jgi:hypothetical protein
LVGVVALILALLGVGVLGGDEADESGGEGGDGETFHGMLKFWGIAERSGGVIRGMSGGSRD